MHIYIEKKIKQTEIRKERERERDRTTYFFKILVNKRIYQIKTAIQLKKFAQMLKQ